MSDTEKELKEEVGTLNIEPNGKSGDELEQVTGGYDIPSYKYCPRCVKLISWTAKKCTHCGYSYP